MAACLGDDRPDDDRRRRRLDRAIFAGRSIEVGSAKCRAELGPACYDGGGAEPTLTDAHLVLGHLPPYLLGGAFALDPEAARRAIATRIAEPMGLALDDAARGILAIVDNHMTGAIHFVSVERGHDPRDFVPCAGGAGPLHGAALACPVHAARLAA